MKFCPSCQSAYTDESLRFCLQDGAELVGSNAGNYPTQVLGEQETVMARKTPVTSDGEQDRLTPVGAIQAEGKRTSPILIVVLTAVGMCLLFGGIAAAWLLISNVDSRKGVSGLNSNYSTPVVLPTVTNTNSKIDDDTVWNPIDPNASLDGDRITYYRGTTAEKCQADCEVNSKCRGFALIRAGFYNPSDPPMCYLLSKVSGSTPSPCCIAGVKK